MVIQLCNAAAAIKQMHRCTIYDDCCCYSLRDTDLNIELSQLLTLINLITDVDEDTDANTNPYYDAWGIA